MAMEEGLVLLWRIENLTHWSSEVHGECIRSPFVFYPYFSNIELYPYGIGGLDENLRVSFCDFQEVFYGIMSFYSSDGSLIFKQPVNPKWKDGVLKLLRGPKFEEVLSRIREGEDFITFKLRIGEESYQEQRMSTSINVSLISVKISGNFFACLEPNETDDVCWISSHSGTEFFSLEACTKNNTVQFQITAMNIGEFPFSVSLRVKLTRSREEREHVFCDETPWTFPDVLERGELVRKGISLLLCFKTRTFVRSISYASNDRRLVSVELNDKLCTSESTDPNKESALDSVPSDAPGDSVLVLSKDLMGLYQDQNLNDITLKCDNVSFPVHRVILSARSPVFKSMLSSDMAEAASGQVVIGDLDPSTLSLFLTYLYSGTVEDLECDKALKLYYAADKYQVPSLKGECADFLCSIVSISNVCDILSLADRHQDEQLTSVARDFILNRYSEVLRSSEWQSFMCREPLLAVKTVTDFAAEGGVSSQMSFRK